jgi:hypothetical protein
MKTFVLLLMSLKDITNLDENNFIQTHKCIKKVLKDENSGSTDYRKSYIFYITSFHGT